MKKQLLMMCFSILLTQSYAQKELQESKTSIDSMLINIDKSTFTSGILYDRIGSWAKLDSFNDDANNIANVNYFEQALHEMYKASNQQKFINYRDLRKKYIDEKQQNSVDVGILNVNFQQLNYNHENENLGGLRLTENKFVLIEGKNPFISKHVFIAAPLKGYVVGNSIIYNFSKPFKYDETINKKMISLSADFGIGADHTIFKHGNFTNKSIQISYNKSGDKTLIFTAIFEDGTTVSAKSKVHVTVENSALMRDPILDGTEDDRYDDEDRIEAFPGYEPGDIPIKGVLDFRIFYHGTPGSYERTLLRPIVIVDGFDPLDQRKIQDSDPHPNSSNDEHFSIEEMMNYENSNGESIDIIRKLREDGFDVIIVNHPNYTKNGVDIDGGADYIERNGLVHASFYQYLNETILANGSSEELVIVGPSMGGQITRYALAYMEKEEIDHNVKLWVSIDSPHLGANIPIGVQTLLNLINDNSESVGAKDFVDLFLGSVAAKQQLIEQYNGSTGNNLNQDFLNSKTVLQGYSEDRGADYFVEFYDNLYSNGVNGSRGYPEITRNIAIVNGSLQGSKAFKNPYEILGVDFLNNTTYEDNFADDGERSLQIKGDANIIGHITTLESNFMPTFGATNRRIALFKTKRPLDWETHTRNVSNNNRRGNLDNVPGGWFATQRDVAASVINEHPYESIIGDLNWGISVNSWRILDLDHVNSFVPTISSLGFKNPDFKWTYRIDPSLLCNDAIPFDTFYAPKENEAHTSFTEASVNWLFQELDGNHQQTPNYPKPLMTGEAEVFVGQTKTYSIPRVTAATSYTWTLDFNYGTQSHTPWQILSGQGTNTITVKVGSPKFGAISCRPRNSCAIGSSTYMYVQSYNTGGDSGGGGDDDPCDGVLMTVSPNPNKGGDMTLVIYPIDPCDDGGGLPTKIQTKNTVEIYSLSGRKEYQNVYSTNEILINGLSLKTGVYVVHVTTATGKKTQQTIVVE